MFKYLKKNGTKFYLFLSVLLQNLTTSRFWSLFGWKWWRTDFDWNICIIISTNFTKWDQNHKHKHEIFSHWFNCDFFFVFPRHSVVSSAREPVTVSSSSFSSHPDSMGYSAKSFFFENYLNWLLNMKRIFKKNWWIFYYSYSNNEDKKIDVANDLAEFVDTNYHLPLNDKKLQHLDFEEKDYSSQFSFSSSYSKQTVIVCESDSDSLSDPEEIFLEHLTHS